MLRKAKIKDVKAIHALIDSYARNGEMLPCSLLELYEKIRDFYVFADDQTGEVLGACALHVCWEDLAEIRSLTVKVEKTMRGIGSEMVRSCIEEAGMLGIQKLFALTYKPDFFVKLGFNIIDKSVLPHKIWSDCIKCSKFPECDETAMMIELNP